MHTLIYFRFMEATDCETLFYFIFILFFVCRGCINAIRINIDPSRIVRVCIYLAIGRFRDEILYT